MATLPKIKYKGKDIEAQQVTTFKYEDVEAFTAEYVAEKRGLDVICYHKHQGQSGQSSSNGCYTKKTAYGGYCRGYNYSVTTSWNCGWCGTNVAGTSKPSSCPNNVCGSKTAGQSWHGATSTTKTGYHSSASGCNEWTYNYRYDLGCGYDAE